MFANSRPENLYLGMRSEGAYGLGAAWLWRWRMTAVERRRRDEADRQLAGSAW